MRSGSVSMLISANQASKGDIIAPTLLRILDAFLTSSSLPTSDPPTIAPLPPINLVSECTTMSAPISSGR